MQVKHIDEVEEIEQQVYPSPWSRSAFVTEILENAFAAYFVALNRGQVVGYAGIWVILDEAHITNLAVHPDFHNCGIGTVLLQHIIKEARKHGVLRMTLEVRTSNVRAQNLYTKFGFVSHGVRPKYYSDEDALIMWLDDLDDGLDEETGRAGGRHV